MWVVESDMTVSRDRKALLQSTADSTLDAELMILSSMISHPIWALDSDVRGSLRLCFTAA